MAEDQKDKGLEYLDTTPVAVPVRFRQRPGEVDRLKDMMRNLIVELRDREGIESFEESLDFEVDDEDDGLPAISQSEMRYMKEENLLTEKQEVDRVIMQRRAADHFRRMRDGKVDGGRKGAVAGGSEVSAERSDKRGEKRAASGGEGRSAGERGRRVSKGDEEVGGSD